MKIGLFGGSFDPIHRGHLAPVREAVEELGLDRVIYLPTGRPPHKPERRLTPAHARYTMVELALLGEERFVADPFELQPDRPAYTVDTVTHFGGELSGAELYLLIGSDSFAELDQWVRWREIVAGARLAILVRPGWEEERQRLSPELAELARGERVSMVSNRPVDLSSTWLREVLAADGEPPAGMIPDLVLKYIRKYSWYR